MPGRPGAKAANKECHDKRPEVTYVSFICDKGIMVPVCWASGPVYCGFCKNHKTSSFQAVYKHMRDKHKEEAVAFQEEINENAYGKYKVDKKLGTEFRLVDRVPLKIVKRAVANGDGDGDGDEENDEVGKEVEEEERSTGQCVRSSGNEYNNKRPEVTSISFICDKGMMVPVCWTFGPVYCGFCKDHKSASFQAIYKHLRDFHKDETHQFQAEMMVNVYHKYNVYEGQGDKFRLEDGVALKVELRSAIDDEEEKEGTKRKCDGDPNTNGSKRRNLRLPTQSNNQQRK